MMVMSEIFLPTTSSAPTHKSSLTPKITTTSLPLHVSNACVTLWGKTFATHQNWIWKLTTCLPTLNKIYHGSSNIHASTGHLMSHDPFLLEILWLRAWTPFASSTSYTGLRCLAFLVSSALPSLLLPVHKNGVKWVVLTWENNSGWHWIHRMLAWTPTCWPSWEMLSGLFLASLNPFPRVHSMYIIPHFPSHQEPLC